MEGFSVLPRVPRHRNLARLAQAPLFLVFALLIASCGGGGGTGPQGPGPLPVTQTAPSFKTTSVVAGKGSIGQLTASGDTLFWTDDVKGLWTYASGSNQVQLLAPKLQQPTTLAMSGGKMYWVSTTPGTQRKSLHSSSTDGTTTTLRAEVTGDGDTRLVVDEAAAYWKTGNTFTPSLERVPLDGTPPTTIYSASRRIINFVSDADFIYWLEELSEQANLYRVRKTGGAPEALCTGISKPNGGMGYASGSIYVGTYGQLLRVPASGGAPAILAQGTHIEPYQMAANGGTVYWLNHDRSLGGAFGGEYAIVSQPAEGGDISVVAGDLNGAANLVAVASGLYWTEFDPSFTSAYDMYKVVKRYSFSTGAVEQVAERLYISSFAIADGFLYITEFDPFCRYSEIARVATDGGVKEPLIGGINGSTVVLAAAGNDLLIGDGPALKKVAITGGVASTLLLNARLAIRDIKEKDGAVYFTSGNTGRNGLYRTSLQGGNYAVLAEGDGLYGDIVAVEGGYVYYVLATTGPAGVSYDFRRIPGAGGASESVYKFPDGSWPGAFDGVGTVYLGQINQFGQMAYSRYDIASGKTVKLWSGYSFAGFNSNSVFGIDSTGHLIRVAKDGTGFRWVLEIPYPLYKGQFWVTSGNNCYFNVTYLSETEGYFSEIELLEER